MSKSTRWFSFIRGDGEVTGDLICEACAKRNISQKDQDGLAEIAPPDPIKSCIYCFKPVGNFNIGKPVEARSSKRSFIKIDGKIILK